MRVCATSLQQLWHGQQSPGEGRIQERQLVASYQEYADMVKERWPRTATLLRQIADRYAAGARREDMRAELEEDLWRY
jgi:hypothetical protein